MGLKTKFTRHHFNLYFSFLCYGPEALILNKDIVIVIVIVIF